MNERKNNGRGIFYGVIGVATLVVAIIGATFAYFTATAANNVISGNMATVKLALDVKKVSTADDGIGMIPMSNSMIEAAVSNASTKGICVDNNGNPVCQVYKITLTNASSAGQFVDGYVALKGGSGEPTDYNEYPAVVADAATQAKWPIGGIGEGAAGDPVGTTMRWAQVFPTFSTTIADSSKDKNEDGDCDTDEPGCEYVVSKFSTVGTQVLGNAAAQTPEQVTFTSLANTGTTQDAAKNLVNIRTDNTLMTTKTFINDTNGNKTCDADETGCAEQYKGVLTSLGISGNNYNVIGTNYIRVSNHQWLKVGGAESYKRDTDVTSALVFNHNITANAVAEYYVAVWLSETGTNQTAGATVTEGVTLPDDEAFFMGNVTFISAQGSEVSATFANHARVPATNS